MASLALVKLVNRKLLKISGPDCYPYLQGLLTNDLRYLYEPDRIPQRKHAKASPNSLAAFMLNPQGRILCDMILYRTPQTRYTCQFTAPGESKEPDELLIECDASIASGVANTLYGYRVRRKISLELLGNHHIWCLYPNLKGHNSGAISRTNQLNENDQLQLISEISSREILDNNITLVSDPRLAAMGARIISHIDNFNELCETLKSHVNVDIQPASVKDHTVYRFQLGVGEGLIDHPEGNSLPLESNGDRLGGVCFNKGCYLGQELTARIYFTGVIRKRLMPIQLDRSTTDESIGSVPLLEGTPIVNTKTGKPIGTLRQAIRDSGLALMRSDLIDESVELIHEGSKTKISTWKPFWWN